MSFFTAISAAADDNASSPKKSIAQSDHVSAPSAPQTCLDAINAARSSVRDLPPGLLLAIAETETGRLWEGKFGPWPWTLNIAGEGLFFLDRDAALTAASTALEEGRGNVDIGCFQISESWHGWAFDDLNMMIDPVENAAYAATHLENLYALHGNWVDAIAHYHSANPVKGFAYANRVIERWSQNATVDDLAKVGVQLKDVARISDALQNVRQINGDPDEYFVSASISFRYEVSDVLALKTSDGELYVSFNDLKEVPFRDRYGLPLAYYKDTLFIDVGASSPFETYLDEDALHLEIVAAGSLFFEQVFEQKEVVKPEHITPRATGVHLNYSVSTSFDSGQLKAASAVLDALGYKGNKTVRAGLFIDDKLSWRRLSTSVTIDDSEKRETIVLGDTITPSPSAWGASNPIFGINWSSNTALDPSYSTMHDYSFYGVTDVPAIIRVLSSGEAIREAEIEPGAFRFSDMPFPNQYGELIVSLENIQGQKEYFSLPYIRIPNIYREGVSTFQFGAGFARKDSRNSFGSYGHLLGSASYRFGISDTLTSEVGAKIDKNSLAVGVTGDFAFLDVNRFLSTSVVASLSKSGIGVHGSLSTNSINRDRGSSFSGALSFTSKDFDVSASAPTLVNYNDRDRWSFRLSSSFNDTLPFIVNYQFSDTWGGDRSHTISGGGSWSLNNGWSINANTSFQVDNDGASGSLFFGLAKVMGKKKPVATSYSSIISDGAHYLEASASSRGWLDDRFGYSARARRGISSGTTSNVDLRVDGETEKFLFSANANISESDYALNATFSGALGYLNGIGFASARIDAPYVLISTGEAADVPMKMNYKNIGNTQADGNLVVDGLVPFSRNTVLLEPKDLGFDYSLSDGVFEKTIIPVSVGGYFVEFPIVEQSPATLILVDALGKYLPSGSNLTNRRTQEVAGVTIDGMAYIENIHDGDILDVDLGRFGKCIVEVKIHDGFEKFETIGPFKCN